MAALRGATVALPMLLLLTALPLQAQHYRWDLSVNGGWSITSGALSGDKLQTFADDAFEGESLGFDNNWIYGAQLGYWFSRSVGLRANLSYMDTGFHQGDGTNLFDKVNLWGGTGDVLIRFAKPRENWSGAEWLPFVALGIGANWVNPSGDNWLVVNELDVDEEDGFIERELEGNSGVPIVCRLGLCAGPSTPGFFGVGGIPDINDRTFFLREGSSLTGLLGLGTDLRLSPSFALRLETGFRFWEAPIDEVVQQENLENVLFPLSEGVGGTVSQFYATLGLNLLMDLRPKPIPVAIAPAPPPPPAPRPPETEDITVCLVDATSGVARVDAKRYIASGDTTILRNGVETRLSDATALVQVAGTADWYVRGAPLEIGKAPKRVAYVTTGAARVIEPSDLRQVGTVNGLQVFVDPDDIEDPINAINPTVDLNRLLEESADAFRVMDTIKVVYVPLQANGCVFQAMQKQEEIRKK